MQQTYLGDGLYAEYNGRDDICIYASNGIDRTNSVYLDIQMLKKLTEWIEQTKEKA